MYHGVKVPLKGCAVAHAIKTFRWASIILGYLTLHLRAFAIDTAHCDCPYTSFCMQPSNPPSVASVTRCMAGSKTERSLLLLNVMYCAVLIRTGSVRTAWLRPRIKNWNPPTVRRLWRSMHWNENSGTGVWSSKPVDKDGKKYFKSALEDEQRLISLMFCVGWSALPYKLVCYPCDVIIICIVWCGYMQITAFIKLWWTSCQHQFVISACLQQSVDLRLVVLYYIGLCIF